MKMSFLMMCLVCGVAAVAAVGPQLVNLARPISRGREDYSNVVNTDEMTVMTNKMAELTARVARVENRGEQRRDSLETMAKDVKEAISSLQSTFRDVSRRMDALEDKLETTLTGRSVSQKLVHTATTQDNTELADEDVREVYAEMNSTIQHKTHADVNPTVKHKTHADVNPTIQHKSYADVNPSIKHKTHADVNPTIKHKSHADVNPSIKHKSHADVNPTIKHKTHADVNPSIKHKTHADVNPNAVNDVKDNGWDHMKYKNNYRKDSDEDVDNDEEEVIEYTEEEIAAMIKACGRPPMKEEQSAEVTVFEGKVTAAYSCSKQFVFVDPDYTAYSDCTDGVWSPSNAFCSNVTTCGHKTSFRMEYNGTLAVTKSGKTCQKWASQSPQEHNYDDDDEFYYTTGFEGGETMEQASNFCRDPGLVSMGKQVWCYTTDPDERWEYCDVPVCGQGI